MPSPLPRPDTRTRHGRRLFFLPSPQMGEGLPRRDTAALVPVWLCLGVALAAGLAGCGRPAPRPVPTPTRAERLDRALAAAGRFLASRQSADGAWRSKQYASF